MLQWLWKLALLVLMTVGLLSAYLYVMQSRMIFYPNMPGGALTATPREIGLDYEDVDFSASDGVRLHGWFVPALNARETVLFFPGNAGNISHRLESISLFHRLGLNVFIIDYRGYGRSEGSISEHGSYLDAEGAWSWLVNTRGLPADEIVVFGRSLGGAVATWLAQRHPPAALILESTFTSVPAMAKRFYPFLPVRLITRFHYDSLARVGELTCPLLVAHSRDDEIIPYQEGRLLFDAANEPKRFLNIRGGHNDGFLVSGPPYEAGLRAFIDEYTRPRRDVDADTPLPTRCCACGASSPTAASSRAMCCRWPSCPWSTVGDKG